MKPSQITSRTTTGDITTETAYLKSVVLCAGSDAATVIVKKGGSGGTQILKLATAANTSVNSGPLFDAQCGTGIHVTLSGTSPAVTVVWE